MIFTNLWTTKHRNVFRTKSLTDEAIAATIKAEEEEAAIEKAEEEAAAKKKAEEEVAAKLQKMKKQLRKKQKRKLLNLLWKNWKTI